MSTTLPVDPAGLPTEQTIKRSIAFNGASKGKKEAEWIRESGKAKYKLVK